MILTAENFGTLKNALTVRDMPKHVTLELRVSASAFKNAENVSTHWFVDSRVGVAIDPGLPSARKESKREKLAALDGKSVLLGLAPKAFDDLTHQAYVYNRLKPESFREINISLYSLSLWQADGQDSPRVIAAAPLKPSRRGETVGIQMSLPGFGEPELVKGPAGFRSFNEITPRFS
jgi:hypothetical protein